MARKPGDTARCGQVAKIKEQRSTTARALPWMKENAKATNLGDPNPSWHNPCGKRIGIRATYREERRQEDPKE
ncbi:hypothetical protein R1flu_025150 [Riccia fluitans]|uniref:Uncharacterized protein n=1 Tax=Riccia fluitans TaxID=41844 RepID=A0ABD1XXU2_9MARC